jgi:UDP-N-acetyl-D-mannosaminuronate dehydrogenase
VDIIHICIPYTNEFSLIVLDYASRFGVKDVVVIIHSTVLPFTTKNISKLIPNVIYSPIRGTHPNLYNDLLKYTKYFASESQEALHLTEKFFQFAGLKTKIVKDVSSLEFAKHYSTLMFGISLILTQEVYQTKHTYGLDPRIIMDFVNDTGSYSKDRKIYPYIEKIGGHCVMENAKLFQTFSKFPFYLIRFNELFGEFHPGEKYEL